MPLLTPETVTVQRAESMDDGAGGETQTWLTVGKSVCTVNSYKKVSFDRLEDGLHNSAGPGLETLTRRLFTWKKATAKFPDVRINDRLLRADGTIYVVQDVRPYSLTMQADGELVA